MRRTFLTVFCVISFLSCSSSRKIYIDMEDYVGLANDLHYRLIVDNPNVPNSADTVFWQGRKTIELKLKEASGEFLAFVEVSTLDETNEIAQRVFRSVAAIDGDVITIRAIKKDSVLLSGSNSNKDITNFWQSKISEDCIRCNNQHDFNILNGFFQDEIQKHPKDLYGSFIYSWECMMRIMQMAHIDENISPCIKADMLKKEIEQSDTYMSSHCIIYPFLDTIITAGDYSPLLIYEFTSYMYPF